MKILSIIQKVYQNLIIAKKLIWFLINFSCMVSPFKQLKTLIIKIVQKIKSLQPKLQSTIHANQSLNNILQLYKQAFLILLLIIILAIYIYIKFFKSKQNKSQPNNHKKPKKLIKNLDQISQKSIIHKKNQKFNQQEQLDSCCQEIHQNLNTKISNQDKLFLQILKQYQDIEHQSQRKPQFNQVFYQAEQHTNKQVFDNSSTQEGCIKTTSKHISPSLKFKRDEDLNKSF